MYRRLVIVMILLLLLVTFWHTTSMWQIFQIGAKNFPTLPNSRNDTFGIVRFPALKFGVVNEPSTSSIDLNSRLKQLSASLDLSESTSKQTDSHVINASNHTQQQSLYSPARKTVGFLNIFGSKDPALMNKIVLEEITMLESANVLDSIESITFVIFGPTYSTFQMPPGAKYIRSNTSRETGDERDTLELLYSHCRAHPDDHVFYIHSKGSFHPSEANDRLRRNLMKAVLHCIRSQTLGISDICGLRFAPIPYPHFSGNMWYARCAYISKLAPPREFAARLLTVRPKPKCKDWMLGINRAAQEHWATSHPSVVVQDVLPYYTVMGAPINYRWSIFDVPDPTSWQPDPSLFPRPGMTVARFLLPYFLPDLGCSAVSYREQQYAAVFGRAATEGSAREGFRRTWPDLARVAFNASGGALSASARTFLDDIDRHSAAQQTSAALPPS